VTCYRKIQFRISIQFQFKFVQNDLLENRIVSIEMMPDYSFTEIIDILLILRAVIINAITMQLSIQLIFRFPDIAIILCMKR